jgi:CO/xanthine dehydrogenase FAD-binding subunit
MKPAKFRYARAETAEHAAELLAGGDPNVRVLAGGQSLIPALSARITRASVLLDIMRCPGLNDVRYSPEKITIGAACRQSFIERNQQVKEAAPLLAEALGWVAMPQVRSRGTVVGCLAQANPGGEVPVVALTLDAELDLLGQGRAPQKISAADVYSIESGARIPPASLVVSTSFRTRVRAEGWGFREIQLRQAHFALVCCGVTMQVDGRGHIRAASIAIGGLNANPYRAHSAERAMIGERVSDSLFREAANVASAERPWSARSDLHATGDFRCKAAVAAIALALGDARSRCSATDTLYG